MPLLDVVAGCAEPPPFVLFEANKRTYEDHGVIVTRSSYSPGELDPIVRAYVRSQSIKFDFRGTSNRISIPKDREHLAKISYGSDLEKPILLAEFNWDGRVVNLHIGMAVSGTINIEE